MHSEGDVVGGRYRLARKIGEGGMATVWEAEHLILHSAVAVKFLQTEGRNEPELTRRFMEEARVAASVRHRNVIEITDFGITKEHVPYMVMERLEGESLAERMARGPLDVSESTRIVSLTLRGLAVVHDAGIVHRDLKPENIFLVSDPDGEYPKLIDFGVSRRVGLAHADPSLEGALVGTPEYMSPEQTRARHDLDLRTDLYSIGVILYEALTGTLPFQADDLGALIEKITSEPPTPVDALRPEIPAEVASFIHRALAKDRDDRFPDARTMRRALADACGGFGSLHSGSVVVSISEIPPPPDDEVETRGAEVRRRSTTVGRLARGPRAFFGIAAAMVAVGLAGVLTRERVAGIAIDEAPTEVPRLWVPGSPTPPLARFEPPPEESASESRIEVRFAFLPEGATIHVEGVPIEGPVASLPEDDVVYRIELRDARGEPIWIAMHPGRFESDYAVWSMSAEELSEHSSVGTITGDEARD